MFQEIQRYCQNYSAQLPENMPKAALKSALFSFTASLIVFNLPSKTINLTRPLLAAGTAGLASFIHSLVIPLFNDLFNNRYFSWKKTIFESTITLVLTQFIVNALTPFEINLVNTVSIFSKFVILPNTLLKMPLQMIRQILDIYPTMHLGPVVEIQARNYFDYLCHEHNINLYDNTSPIYLTL